MNRLDMTIDWLYDKLDAMELKELYTGNKVDKPKLFKGDVTDDEIKYLDSFIVLKVGDSRRIDSNIKTAIHILVYNLNSYDINTKDIMRIPNEGYPISFTETQSGVRRLAKTSDILKYDLITYTYVERSCQER